MKKKLDITNLVIANKFCQSLGPSLNRGCTVCWTDPLAYLWRYSYEFHTVLLGVAKAYRTSVRLLILNDRHVTPAREPWIDHVQPWFYHGWTRFSNHGLPWFCSDITMVWPWSTMNVIWRTRNQLKIFLCSYLLERTNNAFLSVFPTIVFRILDS